MFALICFRTTPLNLLFLLLPVNPGRDDHLPERPGPGQGRRCQRPRRVLRRRGLPAEHLGHLAEHADRGGRVRGVCDRVPPPGTGRNGEMQQSCWGLRQTINFTYII